MFADLHCHPHMRSYFTMCTQKEKMEAAGKYHPWTIVATNMSRLKRSDRAIGYAQSDMVALWNGKVRLVFNSLYPIERGFLVTPKRPTGGKFRWLRHILRVATHHKAPLRTLMQHLTMRIPTKTIRFLTSKQYDYWEFLQDEYAYLCSKDGVKEENNILTPGLPRRILENKQKRRDKYPNQYHAEGMYRIPKTNKEAREIAAMADKVIMMPLTIEGAHVFGAADGLSDEEVLGRIDFIRNEWKHPLFFITFSHHFDNGLCGHSHSLPEIASFVLNQEQFMNEGFTELGWKVIRKLLALDANNNRDENERYRTLIDLKHMSAKGRKQFYAEIIKPCMAKGDTIPLIASHCAYTGRSTLDELIEMQDEEDDTYRIKNEDGAFYAWNINLCDEDIDMIYQTGGLFGLSFDKRMLGVSARKRDERKEKINNINALWNNLKVVLNVIYKNPHYSAEEKRKAWDMLAIGTDNDGYIDPISDYKTANELPQFKQDLLQKIKEEAEAKAAPCVLDFDEEFTPEVAVDKICYDNALAFTLEHYPC